MAYATIRWVARSILTLSLLLSVPRIGEAAPLRFDIKEVNLAGRGLENDGQVIDQPVRNIVGTLPPPSDPYLKGSDIHLIDGTADGRMLVVAYGQGGQSHISHTFVYDPHPLIGPAAQTYTTLGGNQEQAWTVGVDMNAKGAVVGTGEWGGVDGTRLFYSDPSSYSLQDLATLIPPDSGWKLLNAYSVNDRGQILGSGIDPQGQQAKFLLTPVDQVPEPATWAIFGLAAAFAWRKRRAA